MRRVLRHCFTLCSALSVLLCVAVCVLWVRSYRGAEHFWFIYRSGGSELLRTDAGDFTYRRSISSTPDARAKGPVRFEYALG